jgi:hypothetical protein
MVGALMARVTIPGVTFDAAGFRTQIKLAMGMGMPDDPAQRLTWHWNTADTYTAADPANEPYDWTETPTTSVPGNPSAPTGVLQVDYALQFTPGRNTEGTGTDLGNFDVTRAVVTLLDVDYDQIKDADYASIGDTIYDINFSAPPEGLFDVTVYTIYLHARDAAS